MSGIAAFAQNAYPLRFTPRISSQPLRTGLDYRVIQPDPGVVDEDVESAKRSAACLTKAAASASRLHVRFHEQRLAAACLDLRRNALAPIDVAVGKRHLRPSATNRRTVASPMPDARR